MRIVQRHSTVFVGMQETGLVTLRVMSRPGRITQAGHIMTIVRNLLGEEASRGVGRIRMLKDKGDEACPATHDLCTAVCHSHA